RNLRTQFGSEIDSREAFIDLIVLNGYSAPGAIDLWIDDLEIDGYVNLDSTTGPQVTRRSAAADLGTSSDQPSEASATVNGSLLMVRGRPLMSRAVQHRGEPFEWLRSLGFNTIKLSASSSAAAHPGTKTSIPRSFAWRLSMPSPPVPAASSFPPSDPWRSTPAPPPSGPTPFASSTWSSSSSSPGSPPASSPTKWPLATA